MTTTPNDLKARLAALGLKATAQGLDDFLARAIRDRWSPPVILEELARLESLAKKQRSLERNLKSSHLGRFKPIADFDWAWPKKVDRDLLERAFTLDFVTEGRNLVLIASSGLGKTMLAKNLANAALLAGFSVLFTTAQDLIADLSCDSPERRRRRLIRYARPKLLCIDEVGYLAHDDHAADLLYNALNPRYEARRSTVVTTNLVFSSWNTVFPNAACIVALVDRLTHHADVTVLEGDSYRVRESELEAAARRKPPSATPSRQAKRS